MTEFSPPSEPTLAPAAPPPAAPGFQVRPALPTAPPQPSDPRFPPAEQALARQIEQQRADDPLVGVKIGAGVFYDQLVQMLQGDPRGVRAELLLGVPALLAGYACQAATWESLVVGMGYPVESVFLLADSAEGIPYPFSDPMNHLLLEDQYSVWGLVSAAAAAKTDQPLPDAADTVAHVARSIGTPAFGQPRMPPGNTLGEDATKLLQAAWPRFLPLLGLACAMPEEWPALFAVALQRSMETVRQLIDPVRAAVIAIECAVPMAHLPMARMA
ncbi:MAG: hypothetical protein LBS27_04855 [Bifidobacteriaceae bacterium]|jgi:hypothetical protein|nr:hypothetical protein [Bifidobacteriaceae bacterium]